MQFLYFLLTIIKKASSIRLILPAENFMLRLFVRAAIMKRPVWSTQSLERQVRIMPLLSFIAAATQMQKKSQQPQILLKRIIFAACAL